MRRPLTLREAFDDRAARGAEGECWLWRGTKNRGTYGVLRRRLAHRVAYELFVGPIPAGMTIDHLCRNRTCVNPAHLEAVTLRLNVRRAWTAKQPEAVRAQAESQSETHCAYGHEYTPTNTYEKPGGGRDCRACKREHLAAWRAANPERSRELVREGSRRYREAHPEKVRKAAREAMMAKRSSPEGREAYNAYMREYNRQARAAKGEQFCANGHPRTPANTRVSARGYRMCLDCKQERMSRAGGRVGPERERPTHCPHGHEFTAENTYFVPGTSYRYCRECNRATARRSG